MSFRLAGNIVALTNSVLESDWNLEVCAEESQQFTYPNGSEMCHYKLRFIFVLVS